MKNNQSLVTNAELAKKISNILDPEERTHSAATTNAVMNIF
jgi:hypothetical protein